MLNPAPTPIPELNAVLSELVKSAQAVLGDRFVGAYLQGSFAVGDFDEHSDVDFLIVIKEEVSDAQLTALQNLHGRIYALDAPWAQHLDGSYIPQTTLRRDDPTKAALWYLDNGSRILVKSDHDNTLVVRWMVRERGITLIGPEPKRLIEPVTADDLRNEVRATMRDWAERLRADPGQMNNRWYQPFAVLSYCRMLHTLQTGTIESKPAGAKWAKGALDSKWRGLIDRAWNERPNPSIKVGRIADPEDFQRTQEFIEYAVNIRQ